MSYFTDGIAKWHDLSDERKQLYNIHDLVKNCFMTYQGGIASPTTVARGLGEYKDLEVIKRELRHFLDRYKDIADHDMLKYNFLAERVTVDDQESEIHRYFTIKPENAQIWSKEKVFRYTTEEYFTAIRSCSRVCAIHGSDSPVEIIQDGFMLSAHERAVRKKRQGRLHPTLNIHFSLNHLYSEYDPAKSGQGAEVMFVFAAEALIEHFSIGGIPSSGDFPITFPHAHEKELPIRYGIIFIVDNQYTRPLKALAVTKGYRVHSYNGNFMQELLRLSNGSEKNIFPLQASSKLILKDIVLTTGYSSDSARSHFIQPVFGVK
ncbi:MAG: hypothetical protein KJ601_03950 [Nanoarchaeota archaeon]|nr:hypothetical protein [Nanoarchaeota archaeon]MBU1704259.1 hypothetical protein [Nanoarchaeota archaeon]